MKTLLLLLVFGFLLLGCTQPSAPAASPTVPLAATSYPSPGTPDAQALPLETAQRAMVDEMKKTGGDSGVAQQPLLNETNPGLAEGPARGGNFTNLNYMTSGTVVLARSQNAPPIAAEGNFRVVFWDDFDTPNGPDLVVYLTKNSGPTTRENVQDGVFLGELKSTKGMQSYEVPADIDVSQYNSVTLHCRAFNVPWSYAPLEGQTR